MRDQYELFRKQELDLHGQSVLNALKGIPEEYLVVRSHPQFTYACKVCGVSKSFFVKQEMQAYKEYHRPPMRDGMGRKVGRMYNCDTKQVWVMGNSNNPVRILSIPESVKEPLKSDLGFIRSHHWFLTMLETIREERKNVESTTEGEHEADQESPGTGTRVEAPEPGTSSVEG